MITDRELKVMIDEIEREDLLAIFVVRLNAANNDATAPAVDSQRMARGWNRRARGCPRRRSRRC